MNKRCVFFAEFDDGKIRIMSYYFTIYICEDIELMSIVLHMSLECVLKMPCDKAIAKQLHSSVKRCSGGLCICIFTVIEFCCL